MEFVGPLRRTRLANLLEAELAFDETADEVGSVGPELPKLGVVGGGEVEGVLRKLRLPNFELRIARGDKASISPMSFIWVVLR